MYLFPTCSKEQSQISMFLAMDFVSKRNAPDWWIKAANPSLYGCRDFRKARNSIIYHQDCFMIILGDACLILEKTRFLKFIPLIKNSYLLHLQIKLFPWLFPTPSLSSRILQLPLPHLPTKLLHRTASSTLAVFTSSFPSRSLPYWGHHNSKPVLVNGKTH